MPCGFLCPRTPAHNTRQYEHPSPAVLAYRAGASFGVSRSFGADRNSCHFLWYGEVAGEGLRSVGAASPSKSVCSILPLARHLRAGEIASGAQPRPVAHRYCPRPRWFSPSCLVRPSLCPAPMPQCQPALTFVDNGGAACWSPIPLQAPIIPPLSSYRITRPSMKIIQLRYIP